MMHTTATMRASVRPLTSAYPQTPNSSASKRIIRSMGADRTARRLSGQPVFGSGDDAQVDARDLRRARTLIAEAHRAQARHLRLRVRERGVALGYRAPRLDQARHCRSELVEGGLDRSEPGVSDGIDAHDA